MAGDHRASHLAQYIVPPVAGDAINDAEDRAIFEATCAEIPILRCRSPRLHFWCAADAESRNRVRPLGKWTMSAWIEAIYVASTAGAPMMSVATAVLVAGSGIHGDRNYRDTLLPHDEQITLIAAEEIERFNRETGLDIGPGDSRRNVVTRGLDLGVLVGRQFRVGDTTLMGVELCEPCATLGKRLATSTVSAAAVVATFAHRAGLRARINVSGRIVPGDRITL